MAMKLPSILTSQSTVDGVKAILGLIGGVINPTTVNTTTVNTTQVNTTNLSATSTVSTEFMAADESFANTYFVTPIGGGSNRFWVCGAGSPEGVIEGPVGSLYTRTDGSTTTTLYVKTSGTGNTGWTAK